MSKNNFVKKAIKTAEELMIKPDMSYLDSILAQRVDGPSNAGSSYQMTEEVILQELMDADWEETSHPDVMPGCRVFKTPLPGLEGILNIDDLPDDTEFYAIDPKGTGKISIGAAGVEKKPVDVTYLIVGKEKMDGVDRDIVFTFHPGEPVRPSMVETADVPDGTKLTKEEAKKLGFTLVKYMSPEMVEQYSKKEK